MGDLPTREVRLASCLSAALALAAALSAGAAARASEPAATGWWWRGSRVVSVAPPVVASGGLWVAKELGDAVALSAIRSQGTMTALTLETDEVAGTPVVRACPTVDSWEPVEGGVWEERPSFDCFSGEVEGTLSEDGKAMTFDLGSLGRDDVALVPATSAEPFSISFLPPDEASIAVVPAAEPQPRAPAPVADPSPAESSLAGAQQPASASPSSETFVPVPLGSGLPRFEEIEGLSDTEAAASAAPAAVAPAFPTPPDGGGSRAPWALALALALVGAWWWRSVAAARDCGSHALAQSILRREPDDHGLLAEALTSGSLVAES